MLANPWTQFDVDRRNTDEWYVCTSALSRDDFQCILDIEQSSDAWPVGFLDEKKNEKYKPFAEVSGAAPPQYIFVPSELARGNEMSLTEKELNALVAVAGTTQGKTSGLVPDF